MNILWWTLSLVLMLAGLAGTLMPMVPGTVLILGGAVLHRLTLGAGHSVGWGTIVALAVLMIISHVLDFMSGSMGAKYFGATRWGAIGGIIGGIAGLFFGLIGIFVGPLLGVLAGELLGGSGIVPATKSTWGTLLGTAAGMVAKAAIGLLMIAWFAIALVV
jgi:uncharacterized protein YqgC (DUF456 family)